MNPKVGFLIFVLTLFLFPAIFVVKILVQDESPKVNTGGDENLPKSVFDDPELLSLEEGLKYKDIVVGEGNPCPKIGEGNNGVQVQIHYHGMLTNGKVFDSTITSLKGTMMDIDVAPDFPATGAANFDLGGLIRGWQIGVPGMKPGGVRKLVIPAHIAYGSQANGDIPANSTLIFYMKLVSASPR
ncbi:MAG: FKBP-type peptidyl-prolyl cis-trans isomerase [Planctomycetes bacterium]|nr:FKBP-type peptidyl-prolyl cis-trans isomerase [Planctomycetota bacterium]